jgi:hypothetical protein
LLEDKLARLRELRARADRAYNALDGLDVRSPGDAKILREKADRTIEALDREISETTEELRRKGHGDPLSQKLAHGFIGGGKTSAASDDVALRKDQRVADWVERRGSVDRPDHGGDPAVSFGRYLRGIATGNWDGASEERALAEASKRARSPCR